MTSLAEIRAQVEKRSKQHANAAEQSPHLVRELHLVRVDDAEFYFFEFEDALRKLYEVPEATFERITVH